MKIKGVIKIHPTAEVSKQAKIGKGTIVWHQAQIREEAKVGKNCIIGKGVYVDKGVKIGDNCKLQNYSCIFHGATIKNGVLIGPGALILNDKYPRAITPRGKLKSDSDWEEMPTIIEKGASIGAGAVVLPGINIGEFALIGAGAVVTKNVSDHNLVYGNPAKSFGKVNKSGKVIQKNDSHC